MHLQYTQYVLCSRRIYAYIYSIHVQNICTACIARSALCSDHIWGVLLTPRGWLPYALFNSYCTVQWFRVACDLCSERLFPFIFEVCFTKWARQSRSPAMFTRRRRKQGCITYLFHSAHTSLPAAKIIVKVKDIFGCNVSLKHRENDSQTNYTDAS